MTKAFNSHVSTILLESKSQIYLAYLWISAGAAEVRSISSYLALTSSTLNLSDDLVRACKWHVQVPCHQTAKHKYAVHIARPQ